MNDKKTDDTCIDGCTRDYSKVIDEEKKLLKEEKQRLNAEKEQSKLDVDNLSGLALSGGGIRSASFGLGVMQALVANNQLEKMDYMSTVSGGGYIGSALTWALSRRET